MPEEDWSKITDKIARKRVQNRIAQRNYRKNLKQRIENLERQNAFGQHISKNPELIHQYHTMPRLQNHDSFTDTCLDMRMEHSLRAPQYMTNFIQSPAEYNQGRPSDGTDLDDQTTSKLSPEILHSAYPSTTSLSDSTKGGTSISDSPACPSLSPQSFIEHINDILTNNPKIPESSQWADLLQEKPMADTRAEDFNSFPPIYEQKSIHEGPCMIESRTHSRRTATPPRSADLAAPPYVADTLHTVDDESCSKVAKKNLLECHDNKNPDSPTAKFPEVPGKTSTLQDRMEFILECTKLAGFNRFDSVVSHYYTTDFTDISTVSNAQRVSRRRYLPDVLAALREKIDSWSQWEAQGYKDETLKSAEQFLVDEFDSEDVKDCLKLIKSSVFREHMEGASEQDRDGSCEETALSVKKILRAQLPNLWSLVTSLTANSGAVGQVDQTRVILMTVSLLYSYDKLPLETLQSWIGSCF